VPWEVESDPEAGESGGQGVLRERDLTLVKAGAAGGSIGLQVLPHQLRQGDPGVEVVDSTHRAGAQLRQKVLAQLGGGALAPRTR
jgi:hypothetical protein